MFWINIGIRIKIEYVFVRMIVSWGELFDKIIEPLGKRRCGPWSTIQRRWGEKQRRRRRTCKTEQRTLYSVLCYWFLNCYHSSVDFVTLSWFFNWLCRAIALGLHGYMQLGWVWLDFKVLRLPSLFYIPRPSCSPIAARLRWDFGLRIVLNESGQH